MIARLDDLSPVAIHELGPDEAPMWRAFFKDAAARDNAAHALASDFGTVAQKLDGPRLRSHLTQWLAGATFDKNTRELTLTIRRVPAVPAFQPLHWPGPDKREQVMGGVITRRISLRQRSPGQRIRP